MNLPELMDSATKIAARYHIQLDWNANNNQRRYGTAWKGRILMTILHRGQLRPLQGLAITFVHELAHCLNPQSDSHGVSFWTTYGQLSTTILPELGFPPCIVHRREFHTFAA